VGCFRDPRFTFTTITGSCTFTTATGFGFGNLQPASQTSRLICQEKVWAATSLKCPPRSKFSIGFFRRTKGEARYSRDRTT
jgi:hypothetical protein